MIYILGGNGGFPAPDYESAWTNIGASSYNDFVHNLTTDNILLQGWQADAAGFIGAFCLTTFYTSPSIRCYVQRTGDNNTIRIHNGDTNAHYYKLRIWKF